MWFYMVSKFRFFCCSKDNTVRENSFNVFKIICLHLQTSWKRKQSFGGVSYPIYLIQFSIHSDLNCYINSQSHLQDQAKICSTLSTPLYSLSSKCTSTVFSKGGCHPQYHLLDSPGRGISLMRRQGAVASCCHYTSSKAHKVRIYF